MAHSYHHAVSSARRFGGEAAGYQAVHDWFDSSKMIIADFRHRALRHHAEGCFAAEAVFGHTLTNSAGRIVPVRLIAEQHIIEDLGRIPSFADWVRTSAPNPGWGASGPSSTEAIQSSRTTADGPLPARALARTQQLRSIVMIHRRASRRRRRVHPRAGRLCLHIYTFTDLAASHRTELVVLIRSRFDNMVCFGEAARSARERLRGATLTDVRWVPAPRPTPLLDEICRKHTAFDSFLALLTAANGHRPSIRLDLTGAEGRVLARAYNAWQTRWGNPRRACAMTALPCLFCGEPEHVSVHEVWGHEFVLETCCDHLRAQLAAEMGDDPVWARQLLRTLDIEVLCGRRLRSVADTGCGAMLLDWQLRIGPWL